MQRAHAGVGAIAGRHPQLTFNRRNRYLRTSVVEKVPREVLASRIYPEIPLGEPDKVARLAN